MAKKYTGTAAASPKIKVEKTTREIIKKRTSTVSRWLHIYLSMVSFVIVLFFALTGLTLNHAEQLGGKEKISKTTGQLPVKWVHVKDTASVAKFEIVEFLKRKHNVKGSISDFIIDDDQCSLSFKGPGYSADVFIDRSNGSYKIKETSLGFVALINDLHKGRDTGKKWSYVIDVAAVFMSLISITGLIMICFMKKKRLSGFIILGGGALLCYLLYYFMVP